MKVLEVFGEPVSNGGQESFVFNVLQHMDLTDLKIDVLTPYYCDNEHYRKTLEDLGGRLYTLDLPFSPGKSRGNIYQPLISFLKDHSYDVMHIHSGSISILALASLAAKRRRIPKIIVHSHAAGNNKNLKYRITKAVMTPLLNCCPTDYCACSTEAGEWKYSGKAMKKLVVLKNGIDINRFRFSEDIRKKMRKQMNISDADFVIGHVGRFTYEKNQKFIIELLQKVKESIPAAKAILVGTGEARQSVEDMAKEKKLLGDVIFAGNVTNVQDYLQAMDVFVFPSLFEGLGIVGVEAQAAGLPVIASLGVPRTMQLTDNVRFISLDKMKAWCDAIDFLKDITRQDQGRQIRENGFDIQDTAKEVEMLYKSKRCL